MYGYPFGADGVFMVLFWVFVVALVVWVVLALSRGQAPRADRTSSAALQILEERLARGEIDAEEFRVRRDAIAGARG